MCATKRHIAVFFLFLSVQFSNAVSNPPWLLRACFDRFTGNVTVYFRSSSDACNSFTKYELYGRDDASKPFSALGNTSTLNATQLTASLPNSKKWELYLACLYACNGTDTLFSDTVFMDDQPPAYLEPDSVSVDLATQQLRAGWTAAPEPDVMGYTIYKVTATNIIIDKVNVLNYLFLASTFDTKTSNNKVALAAYDSCGNIGSISNSHSPAFLSFNTGQNINYKCTRKLYIDWSQYQGWVTDSIDILVFSQKQNKWWKEATIAGSNSTYIFNIPDLADTYSFYIRSHKKNSTISSSSNRIDITLTDFSKPAYDRIDHIRVSGNDLLIQASWEYTSSVSRVELQSRNYGSAAWTNRASPAPSAQILHFTDANKQTASLKYDYRLVLFNTCNEAFDSSTVHTSILLRKTLDHLNWNDYWAWQNSTYETNLHHRNKQGSTWNNNLTTPDSSYIIPDTTQPFCFKVMAVHYGVNLKTLDTSWSNEICLRVFDTTLIPGAFSPGGINPIFKIINPNLEHGQAQMILFNRWGQKLFEGDALDGWDGTDFKGDYVGPGFYPYLINIKTPEKRSSYKGVVMVLR